MTTGDGGMMVANDADLIGPMRANPLGWNRQGHLAPAPRVIRDLPGRTPGIGTMKFLCLATNTI